METQFSLTDREFYRRGGFLGMGAFGLSAMLAFGQPTAMARDSFCECVHQSWCAAANEVFIAERLPGRGAAPCVPLDAKNWKYSSTAAQSDMAVRASPFYTTPEGFDAPEYRYGLLPVRLTPA